MQRANVKVLDCGSYYPTDNEGYLLLEHKGHKTKVWLLNHGGPDDGQVTLPGAIHLARSFFFGPGFGGFGASDDLPRGHFVLRYYTDEAHDDGHWGLEAFDASDTVPFGLASAMTSITHEAVLWFFDSERVLSDPAPCRRELSPEEIRERLEGYQKWIDVETNREYNQTRYRALPPLTELPEEQQRRLVQWWDRLWFDWLDLHREWRWTPMLGFWRPEHEVIYYLQGPLAPA